MGTDRRRLSARNGFDASTSIVNTSMNTIKQGLKGTHLATGQVVEISLTDAEMALANTKYSIDVNRDWMSMCESVKKRTGITIIDQIEIDYITDNYLDRVFH